MKKSLLLLVFFITAFMNVSAQQIIPLYNVIPNSIPGLNKEKSEITDGILRISKVSIPEIIVYLPTNKNAAKRSAVIICPGGGYGILAAGHEGFGVAKLLNEWGIVAIVLKYRLPDNSIMVDKSIGPLQDAQRAIQLTRQNADKWNINESKIGIMGFSAGGHLAALASTKFQHAYIDNPKNISLRPDFSILIYPVISFTDSLTHMGSRNNLLGLHPSQQTINAFSAELNVTSKTPPAFLVHASDDKGVSSLNSITYYQALKKNNVPAEIHIYTYGGHGFGLHNKTTGDSWTDRLKAWMKSNHLN